MTHPSRYPTEIVWSDDDGGFIAIAPDLPGCSAFGSTQAEAIGELQDAIAAWIEAATAAGNPIPPPTQATTYSGKLLLRMPKSLHASLSAAARADDVSLNQYVVYLLAQRFDAKSSKTSVRESQRRAG